MSDDRDEIQKYRLEKAFETLDEGKLLAESESWIGVANRLYYAVFYMVSALLLKHELYSKTHSGTKNLFHQQYIKSKIIDDKWGRMYQQLFDLRNEGDYADMVYLNEEQVGPFILQTEDFLNQIKAILDLK